MSSRNRKKTAIETEPETEPAPTIPCETITEVVQEVGGDLAMESVPAAMPVHDASDSIGGDGAPVERESEDGAPSASEVEPSEVAEEGLESAASAPDAIETQEPEPLTEEQQPPPAGEAAPEPDRNAAALVANVGPVATPSVSDTGDVPTAPAVGPTAASVGRDPRLPPPGSTITRVYKDRTLHVAVLDAGFEFEGTRYSSLSKLAAVIAGQQAMNGFAFFRLGVAATGKTARPNAARPVPSPRDGLQARIAKVDGLVAKLRAALEEGAAALKEAEAMRAEMVAQAAPENSRR